MSFNRDFGWGHVISVVSVAITLVSAAIGFVTAWNDIDNGMERLQSDVTNLKVQQEQKYESLQELQRESQADVSRLATRTRSIETTSATRGAQFDALQSEVRNLNEEIKDTNGLLRDIIMRRSEIRP